jgi:hypothetical protein
MKQAPQLLYSLALNRNKYYPLTKQTHHRQPESWRQ